MNLSKKSLLFLFASFLLLFMIFHSWFTNPVIVGGDWPHFHDEEVNGYPFFPESWSYINGNGFGGPILDYSLNTYMYFTFFIKQLTGFPWNIVSRIFWFYPFIFLSFFSAYILMKTIWQASTAFQKNLAGILYSTNTYILMLVSGGQMGIALAYSVLPLVFATFVWLLSAIRKNDKYTSKLLATGYFAVSSSILAILDVRVFYIFSVMAFLYGVIDFILFKKKDVRTLLLNTLLYLGFAAIIFAGFQAFWVFPIFFIPSVTSEQLGIGMDITKTLQFYSFAHFSDALSLLHPNWPDNIFGKTYFLRPEFLVLPLLAFLPLFLPLKSDKKLHLPLQNISVICSLSVISLLGVFLAKGAQEPFGQVYVWLFQHIPGFILFRDSTKWYILIAVSYSILIPIGLLSLVTWIQSLKKNPNIKFQFSNLALLIFILFIIYLIRPVFLGQVKGTFQKTEIPQEYISFKNFLLKDKGFSRVMWVPQEQRFAIATRVHPLVNAQPFFKAKNNTDLLKKIKSKDTEELFKTAGVKYVVIPYDVSGEIFQKDRNYDSVLRNQFEKELDEITWLKKIQVGRLTVYQTKEFNPLFSLEKNGESTFFPEGNNYKVVLATDSPNTLLFSQNYSNLWKFTDEEQEFSFSKTPEDFMKIAIAKPGIYAINAVYTGEQFYVIGKIITGVTLLFLLSFFTIIKIRGSR